MRPLTELKKVPPHRGSGGPGRASLLLEARPDSPTPSPGSARSPRTIPDACPGTAERALRSRGGGEQSCRKRSVAQRPRRPRLPTTTNLKSPRSNSVSRAITKAARTPRPSRSTMSRHRQSQRGGKASSAGTSWCCSAWTALTIEINVGEPADAPLPRAGHLTYPQRHDEAFTSSGDLGPRFGGAPFRRRLSCAFAVIQHPMREPLGERRPILAQIAE